MGSMRRKTKYPPRLQGNRADRLIAILHIIKGVCTKEVVYTPLILSMSPPTLGPQVNNSTPLLVEFTEARQPKYAHC